MEKTQIGKGTVKYYSKLDNDFLAACDSVIIPQKARVLFGFYVRQTIGFTRNGLRLPEWKMSLTYPMDKLGWTKKEVRYWRDWLVKYKFIFKIRVPWKDEKHPDSKNTISCIILNENFQDWSPPKLSIKRINGNVSS
jgi:hypothetical protein